MKIDDNKRDGGGRKDKIKLNLGCGFDKRKGYLNCDILKVAKPDMIVDLEKKLPFKNNSIDEIIMIGVAEHITNFVPLMEEFYRICKNKARIRIEVPYFTYQGAFENPTHVRFFTLKTFNHFEKGNDLELHLDVDFKTIKKELNFFVTRPSKFIDLFINSIGPFYERFIAGVFPAEQLTVILEVRK